MSRVRINVSSVTLMWRCYGCTELADVALSLGYIPEIGKLVCNECGEDLALADYVFVTD